MTEKLFPPEPERTKPAFYAALYPSLLETAWCHGYTLACHGSMVRDFDLIAVPWTDAATSAEQLVRDIAIVHGDDRYQDAAEAAIKTAGSKPHGRTAYTIVLGGGGPRLDLSVMPRHPCAELVRLRDTLERVRNLVPPDARGGQQLSIIDAALKGDA